MRDFKAAPYSRLAKRSGGVGGGRADCKIRGQERKNCGNKGTQANFWREQGSPPPPPPGRPSSLSMKGRMLLSRNYPGFEYPQKKWKLERDVSIQLSAWKCGGINFPKAISLTHTAKLKIIIDYQCRKLFNSPYLVMQNLKSVLTIIIICIITARCRFSRFCLASIQMQLTCFRRISRSCFLYFIVHSPQTYRFSLGGLKLEHLVIAFRPQKLATILGGLTRKI